MEIFISLIGMTVKTVSELEERWAEIIQSAGKRKWMWKNIDNLDKMSKSLKNKT